MANGNLIFKDSEKARDAITASQKKEIADLYEKWADEIGKRAEHYSRKTTASAPASERYYKELKKQLTQTSKEIANEVYSKIKRNMYIVSDAVIKDNAEWLSKLGFDKGKASAAFSYVPDSVVIRLVTGQVYEGGWNLSSAIWVDNEDTLSKIYGIMAGGLAKNESVYDIAKKLEQFVRPSARKNWNLTDKDGKKIFPKQVDYSSQRLARTLVQHTYQQSFVETTKDNPFITEYIWHSNGSRVCEICMARDGRHYKKNELPLDHPNGMCVMEPAVDKDMNEKLVDWFNSPDGTYPDIDAFAKNFGYEAKPVGSVSDFVQKYGQSTKTWSAWVKSLTKEQKDAASKLKSGTGLSWQQWYEKNIFSGTGSSATKKRQKDSIFNLPDYKTWIDKIKKQTESYMLEKEKKWMQLIGEAGKEGIRIYSGSSYEEMNKYLRLIQAGLSEKDAILKSHISDSQLKSLKSAIKGLNNVRLDEDFVLRRGTDLGDLAGAFMNGNFRKNKNSLYGKTADELNDMFSGAVGEYGSFTSTSSIWNRGFSGGVEVVMYAPKGTSASSIMSISKYGTGEGETLLNAGTKVKCIKIEKSEDGHFDSDIKVYLEIIPKK